MAVRRAWPVKGLMLQALLLAGLVAAPLGSLALFVPMRRQAGRAGVWSAIRRFILAVAGTVVLVAAGGGGPPPPRAAPHQPGPRAAGGGGSPPHLSAGGPAPG